MNTRTPDFIPAAVQPFRKEPINIGDYIENLIIPGHGTSLYDPLDPYTILVSLSTTCSFCLPAMEALDIFLESHPSYRVTVLLEANEAAYQKARSMFPEKLPIYRVTDEFVFRQLNLHGYPWAYGINAEGQVITMFPCSEPRHYQDVAEPFCIFHEVEG
ncbi:hypothetical protein ACFQZE_04825 [Paenibacillus sp. GCM10027627]|uniref:hypothetical protein n=1 Tax=unclassified Paenibacillus TaxID=185978 RepID=UPI00363022E6